MRRSVVTMPGCKKREKVTGKRIREAEGRGGMSKDGIHMFKVKTRRHAMSNISRIQNIQRINRVIKKSIPTNYAQSHF